MIEPTTACRTDRHQVCGGYQCNCACHGPDHNPNHKLPTWGTAMRSVFGDCLGHEHEQVGRCVYCKTCKRRLYQGEVMSPVDLAELREALAAPPGGET